MEYIKFVNSGGFLGSTNGIKLYEDGRVSNIIKYLLTKEKEIFYKNIDCLDFVEKINNMFTKSILDQNFHKVDNMSSTLTYKTDNKIYEWTFPMIKPPDFLVNILNELDNFSESLINLNDHN